MRLELSLGTKKKLHVFRFGFSIFCAIKYLEEVKRKWINEPIQFEKLRTRLQKQIN